MNRRIWMESLESRVMPAVFGTPWPDASHITVSFVSDSVAVNPTWTDSSNTVHQGEHSGLFAMMSASGLTPAQWQGEILRALQTWASVANLDITQVSDNGAALGTPGAIQGDSRFGDIRVSAMALGNDALIITTPFSTEAGSFSGDIVFNTRYAFNIGSSVGYDLYSSVIQEAGHALGLGNSTDHASVMYENYQGVHAGLAPSDVASIQNLYGARSPDSLEGSGGNDTFATATSLAGASLAQFTNSVVALGAEATMPPGSPLQIVADRTTAGDADVYSYQATNLALGFHVQLQTADLGLLAARLTVFDADGNIVGQATASGPGQNLSLDILPTGLGTFYLKVDSARTDAFGIGRYRLVVDSNDALATANELSVRAALLALAPSNTTLQGAVPLAPLVDGDSAVSAYAVQGRLADVNAVDYYHIENTTPNASLTVFISGSGTMGLSVLDQNGNVLAQRTAQGSLSLTLHNLPTTGGVYLVVTGASAADYRLSALRNAPGYIPLTTTGTLSATVPVAFRGLVVPTSSLVRLDLNLTSAQAGAVEAVLLNSQGVIVYRQIVPVGQTTTLNLFLPADAYTLCLVGGSTANGPMSDILFEVSTFLLSDPIGPQIVDPDNVTPPPPPPDAGWWTLGFVGYVPMLDPLGRPITTFIPPPLAVMVPIPTYFPPTVTSQVPVIPPPITLPPVVPPVVPPLIPPVVPPLIPTVIP